MKKRLISIAVVLSIVASLFTFNMYSSAANQCIEDDYKYVSKVVQVGESNKMIFDSELARVSHKMALDTYKIRYDSNAYDIATTMKDEGFTDIQQSHQFDDYFMGVFSNNFLVGAKTFTVDGKEKHVVAVAFRGTTVDGFDYGDLFTDASVIGVNGYHSGFYAAASKAFDTLYDMKFPSLKDEDDNVMTFSDVVAQSGIIGSDYSIVVTGHSLGGAVANIFTGEILGQIAKSNIMCYTFASPKVCSTETASKRNAYNIFNIINTKDIVPDVGYNVFAGTRLGNDFRVTVNDSEEGSHNLKVTYSKAMEQVINNIDSYYPYIHRICYDKVENGNTVTKDELHIHKDCVLSGRYGLNFITNSDMILYANLTLEQTDLELSNLIVNNKTVNAVNNTISVDSLQMSSGKVYSTMFVSGDISSSNGTITNLNISGKGTQNLSGTINATNLTYRNTGTLNQVGTINVSGSVQNASSKVTNGQNTILKSTGEIIGSHYNSSITVDGVTISEAKTINGMLKTKNTVNLGDVNINGSLNQTNGTLNLNGHVNVLSDSYFGGTVVQGDYNYFAKGDISGSKITLGNLTMCGNVTQTISNAITTNNFYNNNTNGLNINAKVTVNGKVKSVKSPVNGQNITLQETASFEDAPYYGDVTVKGLVGSFPSYIYGNVYLQSDISQSSNTCINNLIFTKGTLELQNSDITIKGILNNSAEDTHISLDETSTLIIKGDATIKGNINGTGSIVSYGDITNSGTIDVYNLIITANMPIAINGKAITTSNLKTAGKSRISLSCQINVLKEYTENNSNIDSSKVVFSQGNILTEDLVYDTPLNITGDLIIDGFTLKANKGLNVKTGNIILTNGAELIVKGKASITGTSSNKISVDESSSIYFDNVAIIDTLNSIDINGILNCMGDVSLKSTTLSGDGTISLRGDLYCSSVKINQPNSFKIIGKTPQTISVSGANFKNLYISNPSRGGVSFSSSVNCYGEYNKNDSNVSGTVTQK